jgi:hypothetical protein
MESIFGLTYRSRLQESRSTGGRDGVEGEYKLAAEEARNDLTNAFNIIKHLKFKYVDPV